MKKKGLYFLWKFKVIHLYLIFLKPNKDTVSSNYLTVTIVVDSYSIKGTLSNVHVVHYDTTAENTDTQLEDSVSFY